MSTLNYYQRTDKIDQKGFAPIRLVYQDRGKRRYVNTTIKVPPANWDQENQQVIEVEGGLLDGKQVKTFNQKLKRFYEKVKEPYELAIQQEQQLKQLFAEFKAAGRLQDR